MPQTANYEVRGHHERLIITIAHSSILNPYGIVVETLRGTLCTIQNWLLLTVHYSDKRPLFSCCS